MRCHFENEFLYVRLDLMGPFWIWYRLLDLGRPLLCVLTRTLHKYADVNDNVQHMQKTHVTVVYTQPKVLHVSGVLIEDKAALISWRPRCSLSYH